MPLTDLIKEKALDLGFVAVGFAAAEPFPLYTRELSERPEMYEWAKGLSQVAAVKDLDLAVFADPARFLPGVRSLVVVTDCYFEEDFPPPLAGKIGRCYLKGLFCPEDTAPSRRRREFRKFLQGLGMKALYGRAPSRLAGARSGVTDFGKNCFAFARTAAGGSSWVVNEPYLVDRELPPDPPSLEVGCPEDCRKCLEACPTGALYAPLKMDPRRCIAYLSYFTSGEIPRPLRSQMGTWVYGCDRCQEACPRNKQWLEKKKPVDADLSARVEDWRLETLLSMSPEHYEKRVRPRFPYIRLENLKIWQRNAAVALGNQGDPASIPLLAEALVNPEPLVRGHSAWALGRIGGKEARTALEGRRRVEEDRWATAEIEEALLKA
ncbi:MAG: HEAT repeat domain-containing protein [Deltaproteobacteria bacterium]|nr:HEAT repeat domain-containing protein [Deltaproteobacteria bacterium]